DGTVAPRASTVETAFSGGGAGALVSGRHEGKPFTLRWPGSLPRPVISGSTATYPEVFADVDLQVTALETGFSEVLVVKNAKAAANPAWRHLTFGVSGALDAADPVMWDASGARHAAIGMSVANGQITLTPDAGLLTDASVTFPLYLDPTVSYSHWTMIND